jgi:hypothetical protein
VGTVPSGGWQNPSLDRRQYVTPPVDGIQDYDFTAAPPVGSAIQVILPIAAQDVIVDIPSWLKGVRVHTATNCMEVLTTTSRSLEVPTTSSIPNEFPSKNWKAWHDTMPGGPKSLHITGEVTCPTTGYTAVLTPTVPPNLNPKIYAMDLIVSPPSPGTIVHQTVSDVPVRYSEDTDKNIVSITIHPEEISVDVDIVS